MSIKLYYFAGLGRAEVTRWILNYGGAKFEDIRFEELPADVKKKARWGQAPLVEFEGKSLTQSVSMSRFFAKKYNLIPADPYQAALADEYVDAVQDMINPLYGIWFNDALNQKEKDTKIHAAIEANKAKFFDIFDAIIKANGGKHLVGDKLSYADLWLAFSIDQFEVILGKNIAEGRVHVNKLVETVKNDPKIKSWLDKRPKTPY